MIIVIVLVLVARVYSETQHQHSMYISRKSRSSSSPVENSYIYSHYDHNPRVYASYGYEDTHDTYPGHETIEKHVYPMNKYSEYYEPTITTYNEHSAPISVAKHISNGIPVTESYIEATTKFDLDYERAKSRVKYNSKYIPKSDVTHKKSGSILKYLPMDEYLLNNGIGYDSSKEYRMDDDDVRTSSGGNYGDWPYFFHSPYEYEVQKIDSDLEKAKDKRYTDVTKEAIPVYENTLTTTDNPVYGDTPFFSFVLNDYLDKNYNEDPVIFKGLDWGTEFDNVPSLDIDETVNKFGSSEPYSINHVRSAQPDRLENDAKFAEGESVYNKGKSEKQNYDESNKNNQEMETLNVKHNKNNKGRRGFKNFTDSFANKFGAENHEKDAKYILVKNQDKGENRRGFHRIYHKDEYQEDKEFYDNNNSSARAEEKGKSRIKNGGSEGGLKSVSTVITGNEVNSYDASKNAEKSRAANNNKGHSNNNRIDSEFNRYRDVAKNAALNNNADYRDIA